MVREPIEQGCCHLRVAEHRSPLREAQVGGDDQTGTFVQLTDQME